MIYFTPTQNGFSLVETLVAISILLIVIVGPMSITARTAKSSSFATEQAQAFFLAQEGAELAQKARDDLFLGKFQNISDPLYQNPWTVFKDTTVTGVYRNCFNATNGCGLEWNLAGDGLNPVVSCGGAASVDCLLHRRPILALARSMFKYGADASHTPTLFTRRIYFENTTLESMKVRSEVTWRTGSLVARQRVEVVTYLYNVYNFQP
jgi:prepilin-type N-terminal cleavage/methylation domain-containing protein